MQEVRRQKLPRPILLIASGNRAPHLAGPQHDLDPTVMHQLRYQDFWAAFERRYGVKPDLVSHWHLYILHGQGQQQPIKVTHCL